MSDDPLQMAAETTLDAVPSFESGDEQTNTLFTYEMTHERRLVTRLVGVAREGHPVRVAAEIYPVHAPDNSEPQWRFYDFSSREQAQRFADEALLTLEYLGCTLMEPRAQRAEAEAEAEAAQPVASAA